jgi:hypothetical protein
MIGKYFFLLDFPLMKMIVEKKIFPFEHWWPFMLSLKKIPWSLLNYPTKSSNDKTSSSYHRLYIMIKMEKWKFHYPWKIQLSVTMRGKLFIFSSLYFHLRQFHNENCIREKRWMEFSQTLHLFNLVGKMSRDLRFLC